MGAGEVCALGEALGGGEYAAVPAGEKGLDVEVEGLGEVWGGAEEVDSGGKGGGRGGWQSIGLCQGWVKC